MSSILSQIVRKVGNANLYSLHIDTFKDNNTTCSKMSINEHGF